jgi:hypothetical protein
MLGLKANRGSHQAHQHASVIFYYSTHAKQSFRLVEFFLFETLAAFFERLVVVAAGNNDDGCVVNGIGEVVYIIDSSQPEPCQVFFQGFRFADALEK